MKKKYALLMPVLLSGMLVACGNASITQNSSTVSETSATQMVDEESIEADTENPLYTIIEGYKDGNSSSEFAEEIDGTKFLNICKEYSKYVEEMGTYISGHAYDFADGKTLKDFDDYETTFSDFYNWAGKLIYFNGKIDKDYQVIWEKFKNMVIHHVEVMDEVYTADGNTVASSISELLQNITDEANAINDMMPARTVQCGQAITVDNFAEITIKSVSYESEIHAANPNTVSSYYQVKNDNNIYLACNFDFTNLKTEAKGDIDDYVTMKVVYDGGYTYTGWGIAEDGGTLTPYPNLLPLSKYNSWYIIEVPKSLQETPYTLTVTINGYSYEFER